MTLSDRDFDEIKNQSNKDLRNAITTLQFKAAGKKVGEVDFMRKSSKVLKTSTKKRIVDEDDEDYELPH